MRFTRSSDKTKKIKVSLLFPLGKQRVKYNPWTIKADTHAETNRLWFERQQEVTKFIGGAVQKKTGGPGAGGGARRGEARSGKIRTKNKSFHSSGWVWFDLSSFL
jgi:hypothetical protein